MPFVDILNKECAEIEFSNQILPARFLPTCPNVFISKKRDAPLISKRIKSKQKRPT